MAVAISELFVSVGADVSAAIAGLTAVGAATDSLVGKFQAAAPAALLLEGAAVGIGAGLFEATKVAASFEQAMADVKAVMTPAEVGVFGDALGQLAITLGQQTVFSAREAAAGIGELVRAGISASDVLGGAAEAALHLAAATGISVASAATVAAETMNAFGKSAADLTGVVDTLAGTANATAATMSDLQFGLDVVSATARTVGLSFEDTTAAIGLFVTAGIGSGQTAGTALRQMLLELVPTTKPAKEEMIKLGLSVHSTGDAFFDAQGHVKSLAEIAGILQQALAGMSDEARLSALNVLLTRDAINAASILARTGADNVNTLTTSIASISAADTAAIRLGTLQGAMNNLGSSVETVQIIVGNLFLPVLHSLADQVRGVVDQFSNLDPQIQRAAVFLIGGAGAVAGLLGSFVLLAPFIAALPGAFAALGTALAALVIPIAVIGAAAFGLFQAWQTNFGGIRDIVTNTFDRIRPILENFRIVFSKAIAGDIGGALDTLRAILTALFPDVSRVIGEVSATLSEFAAQTVGFFQTNVIPAFQSFAGFVTGTVVPVLLDFAANVMPTLQSAAAALAGFWTSTLQPALEATATTISTTIVPFFITLGQQMAAFAGTTGGAVIAFFRDDLPPALAALGVQVQSLGPLFGSLGEFFGSLTNLMNALATIGSTALKGLFENVLVPGFQQLAQALGLNERTFATVSDAITQMASGFTTIGAALQPVTDFFNNAARAVNELADALKRPELGPLLTPGSGARLPGVPGAGEGGGPNAQLQAAAGSALGSANPFGPLVNIGSLIISSEAEGRKFIQDMANAVAAAAGRVNVPPDNSGNPQLAVATP